jgi:hypothetical protein
MAAPPAVIAESVVGLDGSAGHGALEHAGRSGGQAKNRPVDELAGIGILDHQRALPNCGRSSDQEVCPGGRITI